MVRQQATNVHAAVNSALLAAENRILALQTAIEEQDKLVAALWDKAYGYAPSDGEYFIHSWTLRPNRAFGTAPSWTVTKHQNGEREGILYRAGKFPWT